MLDNSDPYEHSPASSGSNRGVRWVAVGGLLISCILGLVIGSIEGTSPRERHYSLWESAASLSRDRDNAIHATSHYQRQTVRVLGHIRGLLVCLIGVAVTGTICLSLKRNSPAISP